MKKKLCILSLLLTLFFPAPAKADKELIQKVLTVVKRVQDESSLVLQKYNAAMEEVTSTYEGIQSERAAIQGKVQSIKSKVDAATDQVESVNSVSDLKNLKQTQKTISAAITDVKDLDSTRKDIQKDLIAKVGKGNDTANDQDQELKMKTVLGDMVADLYSTALTTRTSIAEEKDEAPEMSTTQSIIMLTTAKSDSIAKRYSSIWNLDTLYFQYYVTDLTKEFSSDATTEDGEVEEKTKLEEAQEIVAQRKGEDKEEKKGLFSSIKDAYKKVTNTVSEYKSTADGVISDAKSIQKDVTDTIDDVNKIKSDVSDTLDTVNDYKDTAQEYKDSISSSTTRLPFGKSSSYKRQEIMSFAKQTKEKGGANE